MNRQLTFFDDEQEREIKAHWEYLQRLARRTDPQTSHEAAAEAVASGRLTQQCAQILGLLRGGPAPSSRLALIAQKYTGRISDLRKQGHSIVAYRERGEWWYRLEE